MKSIKFLFAIAILAFLSTSCTEDNTSDDNLIKHNTDLRLEDPPKTDRGTVTTPVKPPT